MTAGSGPTGALRVAVTGGIGSGKSTVSRMLAERGAHVVDADAISREVVAPGTAGLAAVVQRFGREILQPDGTLDRAALAAVVFADPAARSALNAIVHPLVRELSEQRLAAVPAGRVALYDVPLLAEVGPGGRPGFDVVIVVQAAPDVRVARLVQHRGMTAADARARIAAQADDASRTGLADVVVDNNGDPADLVAPLAAVWAELEPRAVARA